VELNFAGRRRNMAFDAVICVDAASLVAHFCRSIGRPASIRGTGSRWAIPDPLRTPRGNSKPRARSVLIPKILERADLPRSCRTSRLPRASPKGISGSVPHCLAAGLQEARSATLSAPSLRSFNAQRLPQIGLVCREDFDNWAPRTPCCFTFANGVS
jgi:hypothetical protein